MRQVQGVLCGPMCVLTRTGIIRLLFQKARSASNMENRDPKHKAEELEAHHTYTT